MVIVCAIKIKGKLLVEWAWILWFFGSLSYIYITARYRDKYRETGMRIVSVFVFFKCRLIIDLLVFLSWFSSVAAQVQGRKRKTANNIETTSKQSQQKKK